MAIEGATLSINGEVRLFECYVLYIGTCQWPSVLLSKLAF